MLMTPWAMSSAAAQVRTINANLDGMLSELVAAGVWSGPDADRFARDWNDQVHARLVTAASKMDGISFEALE